MCSIGENLGVSCNVESLSFKSDFSKEEWKLLRLRSGKPVVYGVCSNHKLKFLNFYERNQKVCCKPLPNRHVDKTAGTRVISIELYRKAKGILCLIPGKKLCWSCMKDVLELVGDVVKVKSSQSTDATPENSQPENLNVASNEGVLY